jgi:hypothetical protein
MNNKGQMNMIGGLVMLAIAIIVGTILLQGSAQNIGGVVNTVTVANISLGAKVVNQTAQYITGYKALSNVVVINETNGVVIGAGNYTLTNNVVYNGQETVKIVPDTTAEFKSIWKVSGTGQPLTYASDGGSRSVTSLIVVLMALALASVAVGFAIKSYAGGD